MPDKLDITYCNIYNRGSSIRVDGVSLLVGDIFPLKVNSVELTAYRMRNGDTDLQSLIVVPNDEVRQRARFSEKATSKLVPHDAPFAVYVGKPNEPLNWSSVDKICFSLALKCANPKGEQTTLCVNKTIECPATGKEIRNTNDSVKKRSAAQALASLSDQDDLDDEVENYGDDEGENYDKEVEVVADDAVNRDRIQPISQKIISRKVRFIGPNIVHSPVEAPQVLPVLKLQEVVAQGLDQDGDQDQFIQSMLDQGRINFQGLDQALPVLEGPAFEEVPANQALLFRAWQIRGSIADLRIDIQDLETALAEKKKSLEQKQNERAELHATIKRVRTAWTHLHAAYR
jgi:hypothetical protein